MKDILCKNRNIAIESNDICINCFKYSECFEENKRPYPPTRKDKIQTAAIYLFGVAVAITLTRFLISSILKLF